MDENKTDGNVNIVPTHKCPMALALNVFSVNTFLPCRLEVLVLQCYNKDFKTRGTKKVKSFNEQEIG